MAKYIPHRNDIVFVDGHGFVRYVIVNVDLAKQTADIKTVSGVIVLSRGVPWTALHHLDESQNALRIVREATEGK